MDRSRMSGRDILAKSIEGDGKPQRFESAGQCRLEHPPVWSLLINGLLRGRPLIEGVGAVFGKDCRQ